MHSSYQRSILAPIDDKFGDNNKRLLILFGAVKIVKLQHFKSQPYNQGVPYHTFTHAPMEIYTITIT